MVERPSTLEQFISWASESLDADFSSSAERAIFNRIRTAYEYVLENPFFVKLPEFLSSVQDRIRQESTYELLLHVPKEMRDFLRKKSFSSVVNKAY